MKISIVSSHASGGGAAQASARLHKGLLLQKQDACMYVLNGSGEHIFTYQKPTGLYQRGLRALRSKIIKTSFYRYRNTRPAGLELFSDDRSILGNEPLSRLPSCDVVNLHWVAGFIHHPGLPLLADKPIVWTLHDMNPFTGGCHYNNGCDRYTTQCKTCPQLGSQKTSDLAAEIWHRKMAALATFNPEKLHIVSPSNWLSEEARRSSLLHKFPVSVIPNSVDTNIFYPHNTSNLRSTLKIPKNSKIVLFVSDSIENSRKGMPFLIEAIKKLHKPSNLVLVSVGRGSVTGITSIRHIHLGKISDERKLSSIYSMSDLFVIPSLEDNLPNTAIESIACGTPVIGFDIGGIPDIVRNEETGILIKAKDTYAMSEAIASILENHQRLDRLSKRCREIAVNEYSLDIQANRYIKLYRSLVE